MAGIKAILKSTGQEMVAKLEIEDCFICDDPHIFIKALIKIAHNAGTEYAKQEIKASQTYSSDIPLRISNCVDKGGEIKITGKFPKYEKPEGFYNKAMKMLGGLNVADYTSNIELYGMNISYKGKIFIKRESDFHISCVDMVENDQNIFDNRDRRNLIRFRNNKNEYVVELYFNSAADLHLIWKTYYQDIKARAKSQYWKEYKNKI